MKTAKLAGILGYLLILAGAVLMNFSPFFGILSVFGMILAAIAWLTLGQESKEKVMVGNGIFMILILILSFAVPLAAIVARNLKIIGYGIFLIFALTLVSLVFDLGSHLKAYFRFKARSFAVAFTLRVVGLAFSIYLMYSMRKLLEVSSIAQLMAYLKNLTPEVSAMAVVVILANLFSAGGFYELKFES